MPITKRLTKKVLSPVAYDLGGVAAAPAPAGIQAVNEFDQMVIILEGGSPSPRAPANLAINQSHSHFEPDLVVIPVGSTVEFPNSDPIFRMAQYRASDRNTFQCSRGPTGDDISRVGLAVPIVTGKSVVTTTDERQSI